MVGAGVTDLFHDGAAMESSGLMERYGRRVANEEDDGAVDALLLHAGVEAGEGFDGQVKPCCVLVRPEVKKSASVEVEVVAGKEVP